MPLICNKRQVLGIIPVSNSQGRNLGCSVSSARTSSISSTQGIGLGREQLRYLTASLTRKVNKVVYLHIIFSRLEKTCKIQGLLIFKILPMLLNYRILFVRNTVERLATLLEGVAYFFNISKVNSQTFIVSWCKKCEKLEKEVILVINGVPTTYLWRKNEIDTMMY